MEISSVTLRVLLLFLHEIVVEPADRATRGMVMAKKEVAPLEPGKVFRGGYDPDPVLIRPDYVPPPFGPPPGAGWKRAPASIPRPQDDVRP